MSAIRCRHCGRPCEDGSGVCTRYERADEMRPRLTFRANREAAAPKEKNKATLSDGLPRSRTTRKDAMNANSSTDQAREATALRDATVQKLEAALLAEHERARAKLMLALNCGVSDCQHGAAFAQAAAARFERAAALAEARIIALTTTTEPQPSNQ